MYRNLKYTSKFEECGGINFLDLSETRNDNLFQLEIYIYKKTLADGHNHQQQLNPPDKPQNHFV